MKVGNSWKIATTPLEMVNKVIFMGGLGGGLFYSLFWFGEVFFQKITFSHFLEIQKIQINFLKVNKYLTGGQNFFKTFSSCTQDQHTTSESVFLFGYSFLSPRGGWISTPGVNSVNSTGMGHASFIFHWVVHSTLPQRNYCQKTGLWQEDKNILT